jgi:GxxExxY protein
MLKIPSLLSDQPVDFVVGNQIVFEIKAIDRFAPIHHKQILNYMHVAGVKAGLLINFNVSILPDGMSRKVS